MRGHIREVVVGVLILSNILVWFAIWQRMPGETLRVYFLDVGQGDAIFIDTPAHKQVLIDGGRNRKVLSELGKIMSFGDRYIDVVIETHPDADHAAGLVAVAERYQTGLNVDQRSARRGQTIDFGDGVKLILLFPDRDVSGWDTNDGSVVARLDYGESSFLFTGDATIKTENILLNLNREILDTDVLKVGHHGSRTSTSLMFAEAVTPEFAVISAGKDNTYGHPHKEVLNILNRVGSKIFSTAEKGTIKFETDGEMIGIK
ncbi:MAG: hypothetical protein A2758_00860 [Candidatus Zambryskibacteria bacterium RIFCSPHIGHO2_01_FULL_49_18]|uniref:Metallo-beta-lactamase domain-containing protein n=2 Tax=Candidatus Zambryskiibacteriota TaxID=1817925 RepID=A0A1G2T319_9BACT|nr:MAG: hypothetical protein A2758_00860 [Candidatus Zambryskibacteria bacterium RIFCSPHIGHO2_01_FULL_49_18]OHB05762.1 MAG: hypothetical protein A3A26_03625 [Candidatus Zambryskibacteria bacterium RIFCSPLOWO2_01_FULL_47_14]